jgi:hypothetical protein
MKTEAAEFLKYLRTAVQTVGDYFLEESWLSYKTNASILSRFITAVAEDYPDLDARQLYKNPASPNSRPQFVWRASAKRLSSAIARIQDRKRTGPKDRAFCREIRSATQGLMDSLPEQWPGYFPPVPENVRKIVDNNSRYETSPKFE